MQGPAGVAREAEGATARGDWRPIIIAGAWSALALGLLPCVALIPPLGILEDAEDYVSVHSFMEAFACAVCVLIFGIGWYAARAERSVRMAVLSTSFLSVALLDFAHLLSFQGMPGMVTPSGPEKAIDFWLAARYAEAAGLLGLALCPAGWRIGRRGPYGYMAVAVGFTAIVFWAVLARPDALPRTFLPGVGLTPFKLAAEYGAMVLLTGAAAALLVNRRRGLDFPVPLLFAAVLLLLGCELAVTLYVEIGDNYNFVGHVYKVAGFWLIYRAVFVRGVTQPYRDRVAAERLYRRLTEQAADAILQMDRDGRIVMANPHAAELIGRPPDRILGARLSEFLAPTDGERPTSRMRALSGGAHMFEAGMIGRDGGVVPIEISAGPLDDGGSLAIVRDISERRRSENSIRIRDIAFGSAMMPIAIADNDGTLSYANRAFLSLWGYDRERDALGMPVRGFFEDPAVADAVLLDLRRQGAWNGEFRGRRRDGVVIEVEVASNVVHDEDGFPICMIGTFTDITQTKQIEAERRRWADAFEHAAYGISITDARTSTQISVNPAYAAMHGMTVAELCGTDPARMYAPEAREIRAMSVAASDRTGQIEYDAVRVRKDGSRFPARMWLSTVADGSGRPLYRIATVMDATERKSMEAQLVQAQKMEAIGNLTGGIAHDFNNLLSVIIINLDMLDSLVAGSRQAAALLSDCLTAALSGAGLTQRLLAFARRQTLAPAVVPINDLMDGMAGLMRRTLGENIVVSLELAPDLWPVFVDPAQLEASILNLAVNARDAMPFGGRLQIATANRHVDGECAARHPELSPGDYATIVVTDTGTGMPAEVLPHIFEPFYTTKERGRGTGLGLSMVFGFLRQSNGLVTVYSEPGKGSTFRLYLPRSKAPAAGAPRPPGTPPAEHRGETILVVEDNALLRESLMRQLGMLNYAVLTAEDADAALTILAAHRVDLVLTDVVMPGVLDGIALAREILARWPATRVVLASGFTEQAVNVAGLEVTSAVRFLHKPFRRDELAQKIRSALDQ